MSLKEGDAIVAASLAPDDAELIFVSSDAQLLRYSATLVRPQGRQASGMSGIKLGDAATVLFGASIARANIADALVVTVAQNAATLPGTEICSAKVSRLDEFPSKGRATGGVRAQRFLKGELSLAAAWVGPGIPEALASDGSPCELPLEPVKRDASGSSIDGAPTAIGEKIS
jgi:DNA gyrase subunit A